MDKCYLDANFLINWKNSSSSFYDQAVETMIFIRKEEITPFISSLVIDEAVHGFIQEAKKNKAKDPFLLAESFLKDVLEIPLLSLVNPPLNLLAQSDIFLYMRKFALHPRDAYHLLIMKFHAIDRLATFDNDFTKVFDAGILSSVLQSQNS